MPRRTSSGPALTALTYTYYSGYVGDTITSNNLTINVGARYDYQYGQNTASTVDSNPLFPNLVPGKVFDGGPVEFKWKTFQPRVGANYALGQDRKTLLRASHARYADQLGGSIVSWDNPVGGAGAAGSRYVWNRREPQSQRGAGGARRLHPGPRRLQSPEPERSWLGPRHRPEPGRALDRRVPASVDRELFPEFSASITGTYRHRRDIVWSPYIGATAASYTNVFATGLPGYDVNGNLVGVSGPVYTGILPDTFTGGEFVTNRPDYSQDYYGAQLQLTKRLTQRWMMHGSFAYNDWKQKIGNKATACVIRPISVSSRIPPSGRAFHAQRRPELL